MIIIDIYAYVRC